MSTTNIPTIQNDEKSMACLLAHQRVQQHTLLSYTLTSATELKYLYVGHPCVSLITFTVLRYVVNNGHTS